MIGGDLRRSSSVAAGLVGLVALAVASVSSCADESLGVGPYRQNPGQPYLPIGLARVPDLDPEVDGGDDDLLLVASTNLDQQFNAGTLDAYSLSELDALIQCQIEQQNPGLGCAESSTTTAGQCAPAMIRKLTYSPDDVQSDPCASQFDGVPFPVWKAGLLTLGGGGPIATMDIDDAYGGGTYVVVPTRFDQSVTLVRVNTAGGRAPNGLDTTDYARGVFEAPDAPNDRRYRPAIEPTAGGPYLACRDDVDQATVGVTSCTSRYSFPLFFDDPYAVTVYPDASGADQLALGHLSQERSGELGVISLLSDAELSIRLGGPIPPESGDACARERQQQTAVGAGAIPLSVSIRGVDAVGLLTPTSTLTTEATLGDPVGQPGLFLASNRRLDQSLNVVGVSLQRIEDEVCDLADDGLRLQFANDEEFSNPRVRPELEVDLTDFTFGFTNRGIAYAPPPTPGAEGRLWVVTRIQEQIDSNASAIVTLAHDPTPEPGEPELRVLSALPLGEEIATIALSPFAPEGRRWMYALDLRSDQIFTLDVTDRRPVVLHRIRGRFEQPGALDGSDSRPRLRFTLASPLEVVFDRRNGRRRMYVTNFENSTLAVIDVTSADPTLHRLVARLGVDRNTAGRQEGRDGFFRDDR